MALFQIEQKNLKLIRPTNFNLEKEIQNLIENNLETVFNCKLVATEFPTGAEHAGRIDTLALSEESNPVIIEYKKIESSELTNQSLFYLSWINDHRGDFQVAVQKSLGTNVKVDWSDIRVICIAPGYKKYDLHAVKMIGANIELWQYRLFENGALYIEEIFRRNINLLGDNSMIANGKNPTMVAAGKKAAITRALGIYSFEEHIKNTDQKTKDLVYSLREFILELDDSIEEVPKKFYIVYKVTQNFVCMEVKKKKIILYLKLDPSEIDRLPEKARDVREIGHYGTGDFELTVENTSDSAVAQEYIKKAFERIGG